VNLADNTWLKLTPNASQRYIPRDFTPSDVLENKSNPVGRSYSGIAYGDGKVYYFGGGHGSYPGNDVEIYDIANNIWTQQYKPEVCNSTDSSCNGIYNGWGVTTLTPLGRPYTEHTYQQQVYHQFRGKFVAGLTSGTWTFDASTGSWTRLTSSIPPSTNEIRKHLMYDPVLQTVIYIPTGVERGIYKFKFSNSTWGSMIALPSSGSPNPKTDLAYATIVSAYDAQRKKHIISSRKGTMWLYDSSDDSWSQIRNLPSDVQGAECLAYDSVNKVILVIGSTGNMYIYDQSGNWTQLTPTGGPSIGGVGALWGTLVYDPTHEVFIFLNATSVGGGGTGGSTETWAYRYRKTPAKTVCTSGCNYTTPQAAITAASHGDVIRISPETFTEAGNREAMVYATRKSNLTIQSSVPGSYFTIDCNNRTNPDPAHGCWYFSGSGEITIDGAKVINPGNEDASGAIRFDSGTGDFTLKNSYLQNGVNHGLLVGKPGSGDPNMSLWTHTVTIENTIFNNFGSAGDGQEHGIYIGAYANLYLRHSYFTNIKVGHNIKSRAKNNYILYNEVRDGTGATSTNMIDFSCGGIIYAIGNVFEKGGTPDSADMIRVGQNISNCPGGANDTTANKAVHTDGGWAVPTQVYFVNNTFVYDYIGFGYGYVYRSPRSVSWPSGSEFISKNNLYYFAGTGVDYALTYSNEKVPTETTDLIVKGSDPGWVNKSGFDYHLGRGASGAINRGTAPGTSTGGYDLTPYYQYKDTSNKETRTISGTIDIGGYEYGASGPVTTPLAPPTNLRSN
jgi:hypothetical protein